MRSVLDACVLFPSVTRSLLIGAAGFGAFEPIWSPRLLEEWHRAAMRKGEAEGATAKIEIALLQSEWPDASIHLPDHAEDGLSLPDPNDVHVLATAIEGGASEIVTANISDFPMRVLAHHGILRRHPDEFLLEIAGSNPSEFKELLVAVTQQASDMAGKSLDQNILLKRAGLPRLAKYLRQSA